jgi:hypothetical protein
VIITLAPGYANNEFLVLTLVTRRRATPINDHWPNILASPHSQTALTPKRWLSFAQQTIFWADAFTSHYKPQKQCTESHYTPGLPDGFFSDQNPNLVIFCNGNCCYIFWSFGIFYDHWVYFIGLW